MALRKGAGAVLVGLGGFTTYRYNQTVKEVERQLPTDKLPVFAASSSSPKNNQNQQQQRVLIIGAGVVGVCTAYKLAQRGHSVVILEPQSKPGEECSHCAAGGMSRQNVVVDKNTWTAVLNCLAPPWMARLLLGACNKDDFKFFQIDWASSLSDPFFLRWAMTFTKTSLLPDSDTQTAKQREMLQFTDYAVQDMVNMFLDKKSGMEKAAGYNTRGSLAVSYDDPPSEPLPSPSGDTTLEPNRCILTTQGVLDEEPSLKFQQILPTWAKFEYDSKAASSGRFAKELARKCETDPKLDVTFHYDTKVQGVSTTTNGTNNKKPHICQLRTNRGVIDVPDDVHVVVAAGAWTPHVLALMDLYAPVYPLKGYAMSVSAKQAIQKQLFNGKRLTNQDLPSRIVSDKYMYTTRLGDDEIRITSIGEFSEWNTQPTPHVDANFRSEAKRQFPQLADLIDNATTYCGHRPFVSDGILLLGACHDTYDKLYVTCGPGSNGWKLAMGSGDVIARLISGQTTQDIQIELGFDVNAFSPAGRVLKAPVLAKICRARWNV